MSGFLQPDTVGKASIPGVGALPIGASVDASSSARLQQAAAAMSATNGPIVGSSQPAYGIRPDPGVLPDGTGEAIPDPLRFQFPFGSNIAYTPRSGFGTPFSVLRTMAQAPVIALCIQCRKDQMASLDWDFALRDQKTKKTVGTTDPRIAKARELFKKPDRRRPHSAWLQLLVDEALTIDACSIYRRPTVKGAAKQKRDPSYKLAPDEIFGYDVIDGSTIKVLLDARGDIPAPPAVAYRQVVWGSPMSGGDLNADQLLYRPKTERTWTPYGMSPIEAALLIITADLNRTMFNLSYFTEGNIPEALAGVPDNWGPKQIRDFQQYWDLVLKGDPGNRSRLRFVAQGMAKSIHEFKKPDFTTAYDLWLLKLQCACFGVTPSEIGFTDDVNKATAKSQGDVNQRRGVKPMARFIKSIHDEILADHGLADVETTWSGGEGDDALSQARIEDIQLRNGAKSIDDVLAAAGSPPLGIGPCIVTATGPVLWASVLEPKAPAPDPHDIGTPPVRGRKKPDLTDQVPDTSDGEARQVATQAELKKYRQVAINAVKAEKPIPAFTSTILAPVLIKRIAEHLAAADTVEGVRKVFDSVEKAQRLSASQKKQQERMRSKLTSILAAESKAFAAHIVAGVESHA